MKFIAILVLFITATMAIVYSRDQLLSFRPSLALLNHHSRLTVSQLGLHRRGCRAGAHWRRRVLAARGMTSQCSIARTCVGIPTHLSEQTVSLSTITSINMIQQPVMTLLPNCPVYRPTLQPNVCPPLSTIYQEDTHMVSQMGNGSATSPFSTCVWASVPEYYWAQSTGPLNDARTSIEAEHKLSSRVQRTVPSLTTADTTTAQSIGSTTPVGTLGLCTSSSPTTIGPRMSPFLTCVWKSNPDICAVQPVGSPREGTTITESSQYMRSTNYCAAQEQEGTFDISSSVYSPQNCNLELNIDALDIFSDASSVLSQPDLSVSTMSDLNLHELFEPNPDIGCDSDVTHVHQAEGVYGSPDYDIARCAHRPDLSNVARSSHKQFFMSTLPKPISLPVIWLANLRGGLVNKLDEIASILLANNVHIAAITESWLHQGIDSQLTQISGYVSHRQDRPDGRSGGGIIVFVKGRLPCVPVPWLHNSSFEVMWFSFRASRMPRGVTHLLVGVVYHPPAANNFAMNEYLVSSIDEFTRRHPGCGVLILGDFNRLPEGSLRAYPLTQVVSKPTREHAILDKIFTNVSSWYTDPVILPAVMNSDHFSVIYSPKHCPPRTKGQYRSYYRRSTDPNAKAMLCHALQRFNWTPLYRMNSIHTQVHYFYTTLTGLLDQYLPYIKVTKYTADKPWVTQQFKDVIRQRQRALLSGNRQEYSRLRNRAGRMSKSLRQKYYQKKVQALHEADSHSWWKRTKQFLSVSDTDQLQHLDVPTGQPLADAINTYFVSVSNELPAIDPNLLELVTDTQLCGEFVIEPYQVAHKLSRLNTYKAPGPDGLPTWLLKECAAYLSEPLAALYNTSLNEGIFPEVWKSAEIIPVPKVTPARFIQSDLRPIALLPVVAKVFEGFVRQWLLESLSSTFDPLQFGCLKGRSTAHALTSMLHTWQSSLDKGHSVRLLLVDFSKAFDRVNHNILFQKLLDRNVPQCLLRWLFSYLSRRQQRTRARRKTSNWQYLNGSMPQGSLLGPLAFLVQIDDLAPGCLTHKYVDDTTMTEILTSATSPSQMQSFLCTLINWTLENDMRINTSKTKELVIGPWGQQRNATSLQTDSGAVERVHDFKLLGVYVDSTLSWTKHVEHMGENRESVHFWVMA